MKTGCSLQKASSIFDFNFLLTFNLNTSIGWPFLLHTFFSHNKCCRNLSKPITSMSAGHSYVTVVTLWNNGYKLAPTPDSLDLICDRIRWTCKTFTWSRWVWHWGMKPEGTFPAGFVLKKIKSKLISNVTEIGQFIFKHCTLSFSLVNNCNEYKWHCPVQ